MVHEASEYHQRKSIIETLGWEGFVPWFLEFHFRSWWQLNGLLGVPLYKINNRKEIWNSGVGPITDSPVKDNSSSTTPAGHATTTTDDEDDCEMDDSMPLDSTSFLEMEAKEDEDDSDEEVEEEETPKEKAPGVAGGHVDSPVHPRGLREAEDDLYKTIQRQLSLFREKRRIQCRHHLKQHFAARQCDYLAELQLASEDGDPDALATVEREHTIQDDEVVASPLRRPAFLDALRRIKAWSAEFCNESRRSLDDSETPRYCHCNQEESGKMIACENNCSDNWYHYQCVGVVQTPDTWICPTCQTEEKK